MVRNPQRPGVHGAKRSRGGSEYGTQLKEKQSLKISYLLRETQLKKYFQEVRSKSDSGNLLLERLERRLDNVVFRMGFAKSRRAARQMVGHGHFLLNGKKVNIPSIIVVKGDVVSIREESKGKTHLKEVSENLKKANMPSWLSVDAAKKEGKVISLPAKEDLPQQFNISLVVEFYSK